MAKKGLAAIGSAIALGVSLSGDPAQANAECYDSLNTFSREIQAKFAYVCADPEKYKIGENVCYTETSATDVEILEFLNKKISEAGENPDGVKCIQILVNDLLASTELDS